MCIPNEPDEPLVRELEPGDEIYTRGLEAMDYPVVIVDQNRAMLHDNWDLATYPPGRPGAVSHYPQRGDVRVTRTHRSDCPTGGAR